MKTLKVFLKKYWGYVLAVLLFAVASFFYARVEGTTFLDYMLHAIAFCLAGWGTIKEHKKFCIVALASVIISALWFFGLYMWGIFFLVMMLYIVFMIFVDWDGWFLFFIFFLIITFVLMIKRDDIIENRKIDAMEYHEGVIKEIYYDDDVFFMEGDENLYNFIDESPNNFRKGDTILFKMHKNNPRRIKRK